MTSINNLLSGPAEAPSNQPNQTLNPQCAVSNAPTASIATNATARPEPLQIQSIELLRGRCPCCGARWTRPLPQIDKVVSEGPSQTMHQFEKSMMNVVLQLRQHAAMADNLFEQWKMQHSHCICRSGE